MTNSDNPFSIPLRDYDINPFIHPQQMKYGYAGHLVAEDGTDYVDFFGAWGTNLLGYGYRSVARAVAAQAKKFSCLGLPYPQFNDLMNLVRRIVPSAEIVRYGKNGSDACAGAVRLARAVTQRELILYRGYHGFHDWYMASTGCPGVPGCLTETLLPAPDLTAKSVDILFHKHPGEIAGVIINPLTGPYPSSQEIMDVIDVVHSHGALMIFDEMATGLRVAQAGMQEIWGVTPDLSCFGKAIANGLPLSLLVGKAEYMSRLPETHYGMTFEGEAVSIAGAHATLTEVIERHVVEELYDKGRKVRNLYESIADRHGVDTRLRGFEPCLHVEFDDHGGISGRELLMLFLQEVVKNRVLTLGAFLVCFSHTNRDLRILDTALESAMSVVKGAVDRDSVEGILEAGVHRAISRVRGPATWRRIGNQTQLAKKESYVQSPRTEHAHTSTYRGPGSTASSAYQRWWDGASLDYESAMASTYPTTSATDYFGRGWTGDANTLGAKQLIEIAGLNSTSRVLEIGCGMGRIGAQMAPHVSEWHGVDVSPVLLGHAQELMGDESNVFLHNLNGVQLPSGFDEAFDLVYSTVTLAHLDTEDVYQCLLESHRVLRPRGLLYIDLWNISHPDMFRIWRVDVQPENLLDDKSLGRPRGYTAAEVRIYLNEIGFKISHLWEERLLRVLAQKSAPKLHLPDDGLPPFGYVGFPQNASIVRGHFEVSGWALDAVKSIEISINEEPVASGSCGEGRSDLVGLFPRYPEAQTAGFRVPIVFEALSPGEQVMSVVAVDEDGATSLLTGNHLGFTWEPGDTS